MLRLRASFAGFTVVSLAAVSMGADSPQFRGPERNGVFAESGLAASWPEGGPRLLWAAEGLGEGFASVSVADGRIYTTGKFGRRGAVMALDRDGKRLWTTEYGEVHDGNGYPGTRTTPTYDDGMLYIMTSLGKAVALDAESGEIRWQRELPSRNITWGISESPLVVGQMVIFTPGGEAGTLLALDKKTGRTRWAMTALLERSAYCSPRLFDDGTRRQIVTLTERHLIGVDPDDGELLWKVDRPGRYDIHAVSPVFYRNSIYVSDGYGQGGEMFDLDADGRGVASRWRDENLDIHHGGAVVIDGIVYGAASNGTWYALDAAEGRVLASQRRLGKGSVVFADGRLYGYVESGEVLLVDPDPQGFEVVSRFEIELGRGQHWAHPVIADRVLYVRHGDVLMAYDVAADPELGAIGYDQRAKADSRGVR